MYDYIDNVSTTSGDDKVSNEVMNKVELRSAWGRYTAAVRDDYEYWRMCGESDTSGKLFLIDYNGDYYGHDGDNNGDKNDNNNRVHENFDIDDTNDKNDIINNEGKNNIISKKNKKSELSSNENNPKKTIQMFFDDNIERDRLHIVDVRDLRTLIPVPFKKVNNIFVKKVEPYFAIIDDNYFINEAINMINAQMKV